MRILTVIIIIYFTNYVHVHVCNFQDGHCPLALAVLNSCLEFIDLMKKEKAIPDVMNEKGE